MNRRRITIFRSVGLLIGLTIAAVVLAFQQPRQRTMAAPSGPMLSECDGTLREIVIQYVAGADAVVPVYREFLRQLPTDVVLRVMCPDRAAFDEFTSRIEQPANRFTPILTGHAMTAWSRDRWIALAPATESGTTTLIVPHGELGADAWPARAGDERLAGDLVAADRDHLRVVRSPLEFDGGDLLADESTVFVTPAVLRRNLHRVVDSAADLEESLHRTLGRRVILLDESPEHHAGMFMMAA